MNARKKLMERRGVLLSMKQEELVDLVLSLERKQDIQTKSLALSKQRLSFWQNQHTRMANLGIIDEKPTMEQRAKRCASR